MLHGLKGLMYEDRLIVLKLPSLTYRRLRGDMIETFKLLNGVYNLSEDLMFMPIETRISNTRGGHNFKL